MGKILVVAYDEKSKGLSVTESQDDHIQLLTIRQGSEAEKIFKILTEQETDFDITIK